MTETAAAEGASSGSGEMTTVAEALSGAENTSPQDFSNSSGGETEESQGEDTPTYAVKVLGEEQNVTLEELQAGYGKTQAANKRFEEAAAIRKQATQQVEAAKEAFGLLRGGDFDTKLGLLHQVMGEQGIAQFFNELESRVKSYQGMSDDQREAYDAKQRLAQYEKAERERAEKEKRSRVDADTARYQEEFTKSFSTALSDVGVRPSPYRVQRMASLAQHYLDSGKRLDKGAVQTLARAIKKESGIGTQLGSDLAGEDLLAELGPEVVKRIEKAFVSKYKASNPAPKAVSVGKASSKSKKVKAKDWFNLPIEER